MRRLKMHRRNPARVQSLALAQPLERRQLLAATATITSLGVSPWQYSPSTSITLGPGSRTLLTETRPDSDTGNAGYTATFTVGSQHYTVTSRYAIAPGFRDFDASGRAIVSYQGDAGGQTVIFPEDGSAPYQLVGLPDDQKHVYENMIALSPNGSIVGAHYDPQHYQLKLWTISNGVVSEPIVLGTNLSIISASTNDAGDVVLAVAPYYETTLKILVIRDQAITASLDFGEAEVGYPRHFASFETSIDDHYGAVTANGKLLRFSLDNPTNDPANIESYASPDALAFNSNLVARGSNQFAVTSYSVSTYAAHSAMLSTYLGGVGVIESGWIRFAGVEDQGPYVYQAGGVSAIDTTPDGRFGFTYALTRTRPVSSSGATGTSESFVVEGRLDNTPQPLQADLSRALTFSTGYDHPTKWGATPGFDSGIRNSAAGGIAFRNLGDANADGFDSEYYLSRDSTLSTDDILLRTDSQLSFGPGGFLDIDYRYYNEPDRQVYLPGTVPPGFAATGSYYLIVKLDSSNAIAEQDESNNVFACPFNVNGVLAQDRIRGRVVDQNGAPVANQRVYLAPNYTYYKTPYTAPLPFAMTDANGAYEIVAAAFGALAIDGAFFSPADGLTPVSNGTGVVAMPDFVMATGPAVWNRVYGRVTTSTGAASAGVRVYRDANLNSRFDAGELSTLTTASGDYLLEFSDTGPNHIALDGTGYLPADGEWFDGSLGGLRRAVNFTAQVPPPAQLNRVSFLVYQVVQWDRVGVPGIRVYRDANLNSVFDEGDQLAITNARGECVITFHGAGLQHYSIDGTAFMPATGVWRTTRLEGGSDTVWFEVRSEPPTVPNVIGGRVTSPAGDPVSGIRVYRDANYNSRLDAGEPSALTGADGYYLFEFIDLNTNHITIDGANFTPAGGVWFGGLAAGGQMTVNFNIIPPTAYSRVSGIVTDLAGAAVAGVRVYRDLNLNGRYDSGELLATTDAAGAYALEFADTSANHISIDSPSFGASDGFWFDGIAAGTHRSANFTLATTSPLTPRLNGTVFADANHNGILDAGELGLANRQVLIDYNYNGIQDGNDVLVSTDLNGTYAASGLPIGSIAVRVLGAGGGIVYLTLFDYTDRDIDLAGD